ncbi:MAG: NAD(P)-binding protein [Labilithrix sp.]|nr:NAD(P)-binding protein [Labilithrix sp.]MCW5817347.1 NAD(P)-binding protein [Labilithrix sp.]
MAIVGGGCAAMAAAYDLTRPEQRGRFDVTVYQQGWRLGGKGASGRGPRARIEEHGLHIWMGFYENAFRLIQGAYAELGRDPAKCPIADWRDAFFPSSHVGLATQDAQSDWSVWSTLVPPLPGEPGKPLADDLENPFTLQGYLVRWTRIMRALFEIAYHGRAAVPDEPEVGWSLSDLLPQAEALAKMTFGAVETVAGLVENQLRTFARLVALAPVTGAPAIVAQLGAAVLRGLDLLRPSSRSEPQRQRAGEVLELSVAGLLGLMRDGALVDSRGFDVLDEFEFIDWLRRNGCSEEAASSPFLLGLYSLMFGYLDGDRTRPSFAAGQAIRAILRMFFTYRGAFFWKMQAGMGDVIFGPLYEVLRRRGVRFEFFHRLADVKLGTVAQDDAPGHVAALEMLVQAEVIGHEYQPLIEVHGLPSWPATPDWSQLVNGQQLARDGRRFESHWDERHVRRRTLRVGHDFDFVVLAVGGAAVPHVCSELVERDPRWRKMADTMASVATQALQIWTRASMKDLGWKRGPITMTAFEFPFDTWSDMAHLLPAEDWSPSDSVCGLAYFCNVLPESDVRRAGPPDAGYQARIDGIVRENARHWLTNALPRLWPGWCEDDRIRWEELVNWQDAGKDPLAAQFLVGNVNPSDRYVMTLPGSTKYRISPLDRSYDNLTVAGDWTSCSFNVGCVEAAVMSGKLAAHALSGYPALSDIVGFDHP